MFALTYFSVLIYLVLKNNTQFTAESTQMKMNIRCLLGDVTLVTWQITATRRINNSGDRKYYGSAFIFQSTSASLCLLENENRCSYCLICREVDSLELYSYGQLDILLITTPEKLNCF